MNETEIKENRKANVSAKFILGIYKPETCEKGMHMFWKCAWKWGTAGHMLIRGQTHVPLQYVVTGAVW